MKIALAQIRSTEDPWENLLVVQALTDEAQRQGADLVCFPENVFFRGPKSLLTDEFVLSLSGNRLNETHDFSKAVGQWLRSMEIAVALGSVLERSSDPHKPYNAHWFVEPAGKITSYHKIHLFDYCGSHAVYKESSEMSRGEEIVSVSYKDFKIGLSICFDLRFPELFRKLTLKHQTDLLLIPAAFTRETGRAHWHTLLRARAIENLSFVAGIGQWGNHRNQAGQELGCFGNSVVYAPWGETLVQAEEEGDSLFIVELDRDLILQAREKLPALSLAVLEREAS